MGYPSIYPTGVTIYNKEKAYSGYTIFPSAKGALLIDMNGNEVKLWSERIFPRTPCTALHHPAALCSILSGYSFSS